MPPARKSCASWSAAPEQSLQRRHLGNTFTLDLLTLDGACRGALVWNGRHGKTMVWAKQTILATGGAGQLYRETTNPDVATGDGMAIAYRAGAELRDMEFMQFHPTVLYIAGGSRSLISEAARGEGAWLVDRHGHRFMPDYDPRGELAPRDVVSLAIVSQMEKTRHPNVYLDLTHLDPKRVLSRFPGIAAACAEFDLDITRDRIPVRPGAHYMMGGVTVDLEGAHRRCRESVGGRRSQRPAGCTGPIAWPPTASLEALVYGVHAGQGASRAAAELRDDFSASIVDNPRAEVLTEPLNLADIRNSLQSLMWRNMGVRRDAEGLKEALENINHWCRYVLPRQFADPTGWELQNMLCVARLMIEAALARQETRGAHFRIDFPQTDNEHWRRHMLSSGGSEFRLLLPPLRLDHVLARTGHGSERKRAVWPATRIASASLVRRSLGGSCRGSSLCCGWPVATTRCWAGRWPCMTWRRTPRAIRASSMSCTWWWAR